MGKKDTLTKDYIRKPAVFADAFNQFVYDGLQTVLPERLRELDITEIAIPYGDDGAAVPEQRYRDSLKLLTANTDGERAFCILGIEAQSDIHYAMPVRNGLYDFLQMAKQVTEAARVHKMGRKDLNTRQPAGGEYLSGFRRTDKLLPVVTLVIYFGADDWDGPLSLREMYDCDDEKLLSCVADYHVNLLAPYSLTDEEIALFHTDLREVMQYIKYSRDKERLREILTGNESFKQLDRETAEVINAVTNSKLRISEKGEKIDMCLALDEIREDCRAEGRAEGRTEGRADSILDLLEEYGSIPEELRARISGEKNLQTLKQWLGIAARAGSIEEFVSVIGY